jgi:hypothetical protein
MKVLRETPSFIRRRVSEDKMRRWMCNLLFFSLGWIGCAIFKMF